MTTRDYTWLQTKVARWIKRTDLAADIPDFIMLAEKRISGDLVARLQNSAGSVSTVSGTLTAILPDDFNSIVSLSIPKYGDLMLMTPERLAQVYTDQSTGVPRNYAIVGQQIRLGPIPDAVYSMDLVYHAEIPPLAGAANGINWLITEHPEVYLAATLCEALTYVRDTANLQVWEARYADSVGSLNKTDWNSGGTLAVRIDTRTP